MARKKKTVKSFAEAEDFITNVFGVGSESSREITKAVQGEVFLEGRKIVSKLKGSHPWEDKTGSLTRSLRARKKGRLDVSLFANAKHAKYLYFATRWHWVRPVRAKRLAWKQGGQWRYSAGHKVSGVWMGKERTGRTSGVRSTTKNHKYLRWFENEWSKRRQSTLNRVGKAINKVFGF